MKFLFSFLIFPISIILGYSQPIDPYKFIATLKFDEQYQDYLTSKKEQVFPVSYTFNTSQDGNGDSFIDAEDACENIVLFTIGDSILGTGRTGIDNRGPNDQRPVVYFHFFKRENYDVYEYWLYYADNDYLNDHEHDWEKYYVYAQDSNPVYAMISSHSSFNTFSWCELPNDSGHITISVDGGSHAMGNTSQNGVKIRFNGDVSKNSGQLDFGDGQTIPWRIFTNDSNVDGAINYIQSPDEFLYGDPVYSGVPGLSDHDEYGSPNDAPWKRSEWDDPPAVPIVYLGKDKSFCTGNSISLDAGSGYASYLWSNGSISPSITVDSAGVFSVTVTDNSGCTSKDSIGVFSVNAPPTAGFSFSNNGSTYSFSDLSANAFGWDWNFGDGTNSTEKYPEHVYSLSGVYAVCLIAINDCGSDTICDTISVSTSTTGGNIYFSTGVTVFPNPSGTSVSVNIEDENPVNEYELEIFNISGELVYSKSIQHPSSTILLEREIKGIYFYNVISKEKTIKSGKIVLE